MTFRRAKFAWQRLWRGWDDSATWSLDAYLCKTIPEMIEKIREHKSYPCEMIPNDVTGLSQDEIDKFCMEKWNIILDGIVDGFRAGEQIIEGGAVWDEFFDEYHRLHGDSFGWSSPEYNSKRDDIWTRLNMDERLRIEEVELRARYNKGMDLFKQYLFNLWW